MLPWYYAKKEEIEHTEDEANISWNFHDLDTMDPGISLRELMILLQEET